MNFYATGAAWFAVILIARLAWDYKYWLDGKPINHNHRFWITTIAMIPAWLCLSLHHSFFTWIISYVMIGFVFMNLFDGPFNILRGFTWMFPGSQGPEDGKIETELHKYQWLKYVEIGLGATFLIWYIILVL